MHDEGTAESWTLKFEADAKTEVALSAQSRMDRNGARFLFADQKLHNDVLTEDEERDLEQAKHDAYGRRSRMFARMTKPEQKAFKELRR